MSEALFRNWPQEVSINEVQQISYLIQKQTQAGKAIEVLLVTLNIFQRVEVRMHMSSFFTYQ